MHPNTKWVFHLFITSRNLTNQPQSTIIHTTGAMSSCTIRQCTFTSWNINIIIRYFNSYITLFISNTIFLSIWSSNIICCTSGMSVNHNLQNSSKIIIKNNFLLLQYAAAVGSSIFSLPQYPLNLAALAAAHNKNSSIADLRLKAKKHAEALGLTTENPVWSIESN